MRIDIQNAILLVLCLVLLLFVFSFSASAESSDEFVPLPVVSANNLPVSSYKLLYDGPNGSLYIAASDQNSDDVYCFAGSVSGSNRTVVFASESPNQVVIRYRNSITYPTNIHDDSTNLYYVNTTFVATDSIYYVPQYSSIQEGLSALSSALAESESTSIFQYSLPPGNVAYIEMGASSAINLSMDFPELSNSFGTPFSKANSAYALVDTLPTVGSTVASGTVIPWAKSGRLNLIGQTSEASFGPVGPIASRYVAVINPSYYDHVLATGSYRQNPPIHIVALNVLSIQVYPLQSDFTFNNDTGQITTTIAGDAYSGNFDSETGEIIWSDPYGGSSAPALGGNNLPESGNSIFDTLRNIASDFSEFLKGPVSAIRVVVSSIRDFMGTFTQLYTWLPSPVYNLITSALMIALTIGVIKIFV